MKWLIVFALLCSFSLTVQAQIKVGNGGDIVHTSDGRWILADFYLNKIEKPYIGPSADANIASRIRSSRWLGFLDVDHMMLARKLTDAENRKVGLGVMLIEALESYKINWSDGTLQFTVNERDLIAKLEKEGHELKRAAARRDDWILFNWEVWNHLSAENRIGLLMHEAIFALVSIECDRQYPIICSQDKERAMELVADLFTDKNTFDSKGLTIAENYLGNANPEAPTMKVYNTADNLKTVLASWRDESLGRGNWAQFCKAVMANGPLKLRTFVSQPLYMADRAPFQSDIGYQYSLVIREIPLRWERMSQVDDADMCEAFLGSSYRSWRQKRAESKLFNQRGNFWWDFREIITGD